MEQRCPDHEEDAMSLRMICSAVAAFGGLAVLPAPLPARAQDATPAAGASQPAEEPPPVFDSAFLSNEANIKIGEGVWQTQCHHCHGNAAYPGKAPKLRPGAYTPDFVYDRVTYGFRGMPPWKAVFSLEERKGVVAYIKSNRFSP
jgi:mono/diheme cytochrome c family protein